MREKEYESTSSIITGSRADGKAVSGIVFTVEDYALPKNKRMLEEKLAGTGLRSWQFVHVSEIWSDFNKNWVYEHKDLSTHAFLLLARHRESNLPHLPDGTFIVDTGNAFKDPEGPILEKLGASCVYTLRPVCHHKFSTLDSHENAHIKAAQRQCRLHAETPMATHIEMLKCIASFEESTRKKYWRKNYMLQLSSFENLTRDEVRKHFYGNGDQYQSHLEECHKLYHQYVEHKRLESLYGTYNLHQKRTSGFGEAVSRFWAAKLPKSRISKKRKIFDS